MSFARFAGARNPEDGASLYSKVKGHVRELFIG
jgi:hypothetical protein